MNMHMPAASIEAEHAARAIEVQAVGPSGHGEALSPAWLYADNGRDPATLGPRGELRFFQGVAFVAPACVVMWVAIFAVIRWLA